MSQKYILITGSSGFYGKRFVQYFSKQKKFKVLAIDKNQISNKNKNFFFKNINLNNYLELKRFAKLIKKKKIGIDIIIHLAGIVSNENLKKNLENNFYTTKNIVKFSRLIGVKKIIYMSAIAANYKIKTNYAISKLKAEKYLKSFNGKWIVLRPSLTFGKNGEEFELIINFIKKFRFFLFTNKKVIKQPIYIDDIVKISEKIICFKNNSIWNRSINIVGDKSYSLEKFAFTIAKFLGLKIMLIKIPFTLLKCISYIFNYIYPKILSKDKFFGLVQGPEIKNDFVEKILKYKISNTEKKLKRVLNAY